MRRSAIFFLGIIASLLTACGTDASRTVYLKDYLTDEMLQTDAYPAIRAALEDCIGHKGSTLVLPGGVLPVRKDFCYEKYMNISNNAPGYKRIAFDLEGVDGLTIEGNGTQLLFSGYISPFYIENSSDIVVKDLSIDFTRTFTSEGRIVTVGDGWAEIEFPKDYVINLPAGVLRFKDADGVLYPYSHLLEFDSERKEVAHYVHDWWLGPDGLRAEALPNGNYKCFIDRFEATPGNILVFGATERLNPGFTLDSVDGFTLENVDIWACCGMGVIAERSSDLLLDNVRVVPSPGKGRMVSISADATHFINCKGFIRMVGCTFMNQIDDATNIHGWYAVAQKKPSDNQLVLWSNYEVDFARPGMRMEFVSHNTMMTYDTLTVKNVLKYNDELSLVTFDRAIPECFEVKDVLADVDANTAEVLIKGCYIGNNRARGLLIGSKGPVVIEENVFHSPGTAILFEGDGNYWYEQSGVKDVTIRNNTFENCLYGCRSWGPAYIAVGSGIPQKELSRYHSGIKVEGNIFKTFDPRILNLCCVDGVTYRDNKVIMNEDYEYGRPGEPLVTTFCDNVTIEE